MERRKFVVGLGSLAAGASAAMGTGAFTSQSADRDFTVQRAADNDAYLTLGQCPNSPNSAAYASVGSNGELVIDISGSGNGGQGINTDGHTRFDDLFHVKNQGTQAVNVFMLVNGNGDADNTYFYDSDNPSKGVSPDAGNPGAYSDQYDSDPLGPSSVTYSARLLGTGEEFCVGLDIETGDGNLSTALAGNENLQVIATADSPNSVQGGPSNNHG